MTPRAEKKELQIDSVITNSRENICGVCERTQILQMLDRDLQQER